MFSQKKKLHAKPRRSTVSYGNYPAPLRQRGVALFAVMVIVLLSMLLALWASRSALFNEMVVGNDSDYQRAYEAAQAMMQDAELDIRRSSRVGGLRMHSTTIMQIPESRSEFDYMRGALETAASGVGCQDALCLLRPSTEDPDFWNDMAKFVKWMSAGARYGQYTGAAPVVGGKSITDNPILRDRAWYWIEIGPYADCGLYGHGGDIPDICSADGLVYRITAVAWGLKPGTQVVLQQIYIDGKPV